MNRSAVRRRALAPLITAMLVAACAPRAPQEPAPMFAKRADARHGMVTASHPDAAAAGAAILRAGGNAIDAAVATAFALAVVDPSQTGVGAGGTMIVWRHDARRAEALDFYPRSGADPDWARVDSAAARRPVNGRAAAIPGAVAGLLEAHAKWGKLTRAQVMAPAIALARDGFTVSPLLARTSEGAKAKLAADSAAAALFLPNGAALRPGDHLVQAELARTLETIARDGARVFYEGPMARATVDKMRALGSPVTVADFAAYPVTAHRPLCSAWMGYTLLSAAPPMGGATTLAALNLLAAAGAQTLGSPTTQPAAALQLLGAMRVASADAGRYRGDPAVFAVPARGITSPAFALTRVELSAKADGGASIEPGNPWAADAAPAAGSCATLDAYGPSPLPPAQAVPERQRRTGGDDDAWAGSNTSHFSVVDGDRNAVSLTFTVGVLFGSGVYVNGFFLNSAASNFDDATRGPNRIASSTISPTIILQGNDVRMVVGAAGSQYIPTATTQVAWRHLALGEDPWLAIASPRVQPAAGRTVEVEPGFAPEVYAAMRTHGYQPLSRAGDIMFGGVHAIAVMRGRLIGVADPRRDGAAVGY